MNTTTQREDRALELGILAMIAIMLIGAIATCHLDKRNHPWRHMSMIRAMSENEDYFNQVRPAIYGCPSSMTFREFQAHVKGND